MQVAVQKPCLNKETEIGKKILNGIRNCLNKELVNKTTNLATYSVPVFHIHKHTHTRNLNIRFKRHNCRYLITQTHTQTTQNESIHSTKTTHIKKKKQTASRCSSTCILSTWGHIPVVSCACHNNTHKNLPPKPGQMASRHWNILNVG